MFVASFRHSSRNAIRNALGDLVSKQLENPTARSIGKLFQKHLTGRSAWVKRPGVAADRIESEITSLVSDLRADIGSPATISADSAQRKARYTTRALLPAYGETAIPEHDEDKWFNAALVEDRADVVDKLAIFMEKNAGVIGDALDFGTSMKSSWRSSEKHRETDWYKFQEAVKTHLDECWTLLEKQFPELTK